MTFKFEDRQYVCKPRGDYRFSGYVVARYLKLSGAVRYEVENADGLNHIFNEGQLMAATPPDPTLMRPASAHCQAPATRE